MITFRTVAAASARVLAVAGLLVCGLPQAQAQSPADTVPHMEVVKGNDISGKIYKKLGLPNLQYCWDTCLKEDRCTGARWGVIEGDEAGMCLLMSGELALKATVKPRTDDGKRIRVVAGRKHAGANGKGT